jgi:phosphopantothenoylcysteine decarboxylase/phosphopantothenate--cysteine ligase
VVALAQAKRAKKGCDWIIANDVSGDVMGGDANSVHIVSADGVESWERLPKSEVASRIAARIADTIEGAQ